MGASEQQSGMTAPVLGRRCNLVFPEESAHPAVPCRVRPLRILEDELAAMVDWEEVRIECTWSYVPVPEGATVPPPQPLVVAHTLAGGQGPDLRLLPDPEPSARREFEEQHQQDLEAGQCLLVFFETRDLELVLVPVMVAEGQNGPTPAYWGYTVPAYLLSLMARVLHLGKLVVVLDLDETLLLAHTKDTLEQRKAAIQSDMKQKTAQVAAVQGRQQDAEQRRLLESELAVVTEEQALIERDLELLKQFKEGAQVKVVNTHPEGAVKTTTLADWETAREPGYTNPGQVKRPVIRLTQPGQPMTILTRVDPSKPSTSILLRPRTGWEELLHNLNGDKDFRKNQLLKKRWEVYICTTAERRYAQLAWSLLDPQGSLFPLQELPWRLLSVPSRQKKDLLNVLRLQTLQALEQPLATDATRVERPPLPTVVPMCVIVDDRTDVYDPVSRQAVLQVLPFNPYLEAACQTLGAQGVPSHVWHQVEDSRKELIRVLELLMHVRSQSYLHVDTVIKKKAKTLPVTGCPEDQQSSAEAILSWLRPLPPVQAFLKNQRRPASLPAADQPQLGESQHLYGHPYVQEDDMPEQPSLQQQLDPAQQHQQVFAQQQEPGPISRKRSHDLSVNPADLESPFATAATPAAVAQQQGTYVKRELVDEQFEPPAKLPRTSGPQATVTGPAAAAGGDGGGGMAAAAGSTQPMGAAAGSARQAVWAAAQAGGDNDSYLPQQQQTGSVPLPPGLSSGHPPGLGTSATQGGLPQQPVAPTQLPNALSGKQSGQQLLPGLRLPSGSGRQQQQSLQEQPSGASLPSWPQIPGLQRSTHSSEPQQQQQQQQQRADETQGPGETGLLPASSAGQQQQQPQGPSAGLGNPAAVAAAGVSRPAAPAAESPAAAAAAYGAPEGQQLPPGVAAVGSSRQSLEQQQQRQQQQHALLLPHGLQMLQKYLQEQPQLARQAQQAAIAAAAAARANSSSNSDALAPHKRALAALKAAAEAPGNAEAQQQYRELIPAAWQQLGSAQDLWRVLQLLRACKASNACAEMSQQDQKLAASMVELVFLDTDVAAFCGAAGAADVDRRVAAAMAAEQAEAAGDPRVAAAASAVQARVAAQRAAAVGGIPAAPADGAAASAPGAAGASRATANQAPGTSSAAAVAAAAAAAAARKARAGAGAAAATIPRTTGSGGDPGRPAAAQQQQQQALLPQQQQQHEEEEDHELRALQEETSCPSTPPAPPPPPPIEQQRPQMLPPHQHYLQQLRSQESAIQLRQGQQANLAAARGLAAQPSSTMAAAAAAAAAAVNSDSEGLQGLCSSGEEQGEPGGPRGGGRSSSDMSESSGDSQRGSSQRARRVQQQQQQQPPPPPPPPPPEEEQSPPPPLPSPLLEQEEEQPLLPQGVQPPQQQQVQQQTARLQQHTAPPWKAVRPGQPAGGSPASTSRGVVTPWGRPAPTPVWRASLSAAAQTSQHPNTTAAAAGGGGGNSGAGGDVWVGRQQQGAGEQGGGSSGRAADGEAQQQGLSAGLEHVQREGSGLASWQSQAQVLKYSWWVPPASAEADEPVGGEGQGGGEEEGGGDTDTCEEGSEDNRPPQTAQQELEAHFGKMVKYNFEKMERTGNGSVMVMCAKLHRTTCIDSEVIESAMASAAHPALAVEAAARKLAEQLGLQVPPSP